jgi:hypothetical protein
MPRALELLAKPNMPLPFVAWSNGVVENFPAQTSKQVG